MDQSLATSDLVKITKDVSTVTTLTGLGEVFARLMIESGGQQWATIEGRRLIASEPWTRLPRGVVVSALFEAAHFDKIATGKIPVAARDLLKGSDDVIGMSDIGALCQVMGERCLVIPLNGAQGTFDFVLVRGDCDDSGGMVAALICHLVWWKRIELWTASGALQEILSSRELSVLYWMKEGKSHRDIATILGLSHRVIEYHASNVLRKLDAGDKVTAVLNAVRRAILPL